MEIRDLRLVVTLADELHFGRAAQRLHVGQPALSQQLRRLERRLGLLLFERTTHSVRLTPAGHDLVREARPILAQVDQVWATVRAHRPDGQLRVGCLNPTYDLSVVLVAAIRTGLPDLDVRESAVPNLTTARHRLRNGDLDLYLGLPGDEADLESFPLRSDPFGVYVGLDHPWSARPSLPLRELEGVPVLVDPNSEAPEYVAVVERMTSRAGVPLTRTRLGSSSVDAAVLAAAHGAEPVVGPRAQLIPPGVRWVPFSDDHAHESLHAIWLSGRTHEPLVRALAEVRATCASHGWEVRTG